MRAGVASIHISSTSQLSTGVVESDDVLDGTLVDADINAAAGIKFSKLDGAAIDSALIPDGHATRNLGDGGKYWAVAWIYQLLITYFASDCIPSGDNTWDLGSAALPWKAVYVNDIQGSARGMIMSFGA